jgi:Tol biopolymer transport system component
MKRLILMAVAWIFMASPAWAGNDLFDWIDQQHSRMRQRTMEDGARLVTLEPGENEMFPKPSPDGKYLLVASGRRKSPAITRRLAENGDPLNVVISFDGPALESFSWQGNKNVSFLSYRAGGLGVWTKPVEGGALRRLYQLDGQLTHLILLPDGGLIAVRLHAANSNRRHAGKHDGFENWQTSDRQPHLVRISKDGAESDLALGDNPALAPDGKHLVFSMQAGRSRHLFTMGIDGSDLVQLTQERSIDVQPAWSPDGKWIVFTSNRARADMRNPRRGNWDIWAIDRQGRQLTQLTRNKARDGGPAVAADGQVYFHSDRKISKEEIEWHQVRGSTSGFHIWSVALP